MGILFEDHIDSLPRSVKEDLQAQRFVHPFSAVMQGLKGETCSEVASVSFPDSEGSNDVVEYLVPAPKQPVIHGRAVVLKIDPARNDYGRR